MLSRTALVLLALCVGVYSFNIRPNASVVKIGRRSPHQKLSLVLFSTEDDDGADSDLSDGVVELSDEASIEENDNKQVAPFLSQGDVSDDALKADLSDPKQVRVIIYIILSLIPVLFLIPLMLGSRDLIPMDALPPVEMN